MEIVVRLHGNRYAITLQSSCDYMVIIKYLGGKSFISKDFHNFAAKVIRIHYCCNYAYYFRSCKNIEEVAGWKMTPPRDFDKLSDIIFVHVHERVSPTTLKRLWGYVDEDVKPALYA